MPNRPTSDNVGEFSIVRRRQGADTAGGASPVRMVTPSGTNALRGNALRVQPRLEFRREHVLQQALGPAGQLSEPQPVRRQRRRADLRKDKLFFFGNYEGFRQNQQVAQNYTIPADSDLLTGVFRYVAR